MDETNRDHNGLVGCFQHGRGFGGLFSFHLRRIKKKKKKSNENSQQSRAVHTSD